MKRIFSIIGIIIFIIFFVWIVVRWNFAVAFGLCGLISLAGSYKTTKSGAVDRRSRTNIAMLSTGVIFLILAIVISYYSDSM